MDVENSSACCPHSNMDNLPGSLPKEEVPGPSQGQPCLPLGKDSRSNCLLLGAPPSCGKGWIEGLRQESDFRREGEALE